MRAPRLHFLTAVVCMAISTPSHADVVFRVPEVVVTHEVVARPVGTGSINNTKSNQTEEAKKREMGEITYEEYFVEHEVATGSARKAAQQYDSKQASERQSGCNGVCSRTELRYCERRVLLDHCCCERGFLPEPLPFIPHTCYLGPSTCRPIAGDCAKYARIRDCCCLDSLAEKWKSILSHSSRNDVSTKLIISTAILYYYMFAIK